MSSSFLDLGIPPSSSTVSVKIFNVVDEPTPHTVKVPAAVFLSPVLPGHENLGFPVFAFLIEHNATGKRVMFDLGPREDLENTAPVIAEAVKAGVVAMPVKKDIVQQLKDEGVELRTLDAVIWRFVCWPILTKLVDKLILIGDMSKFPPSIDLVFSQEMNTNTSDPRVQLQPSDTAARKLVSLDFTNSPLEIGGFKSLDYFGDGSLYLLDVPGHLEGHICALARATPTNFLFLAGDACFHPGLLRPTAELHHLYPYPSNLITSTRHSISATHFSSGPNGVEFDLMARTEPLLDISESGYFEDPPLARKAIHQMRAFDMNPDVLVVCGHDESFMSVVGKVPRLLDDWKGNGWKEALVWAFLDATNPAFRFNNAKST